jgi:diaminohydroxyphosphoribosylaminopyrimidine deaminase / 5-amino-6-(5-phosphoribosylamino)uracil reductase
MLTLRIRNQGFFMKQPIDLTFMKRALFLAALARGKVGKGPLVGAVYVKNGQILAEGYHRQENGLHAEYDALQHVDVDVTGSMLYVNLEPCAHADRYAACTPLILEKKLTHVVIGSLDPNPIENGDGVKMLKQAGIQVTLGVLEAENRELNQAYFERFQ